MKVRILPATLLSLSLLAIPVMAQDGAASFKTRCAPCHGDQGQVTSCRRNVLTSRCAPCHGDQGQGKPNGAPKVAGSTKDVSTVLTKGGLAKAPHIKPMNTLNAAQISAISAYVKTLK